MCCVILLGHFRRWSQQLSHSWDFTLQGDKINLSAQIFSAVFGPRELRDYQATCRGSRLTTCQCFAVNLRATSCPVNSPSTGCVSLIRSSSLHPVCIVKFALNFTVNTNLHEGKDELRNSHESNHRIEILFVDLRYTLCLKLASNLLPKTKQEKIWNLGIQKYKENH